MFIELLLLLLLLFWSSLKPLRITIRERMFSMVQSLRQRCEKTTTNNNKLSQLKARTTIQPYVKVQEQLSYTAPFLEVSKRGQATRLTCYTQIYPALVWVCHSYVHWYHS